MTNIESFDKYTKLISNLAFFLFIIAGNYVGDLYSCTLRKIFKDSLVAKHIIGFCIMLFFIGLTQEEFNVKQKIFFSGGLYIIFLIIMRAPYYISLFSVISITLMYLINLYIIDLEKIDDIPSVKLYTQINDLLFVMTICGCILGGVFYIFKARQKHKNKFRILKFLLGKKDEECHD